MKAVAVSARRRLVRMHAARLAAWRERTEDGQALVLALIVVLLIGLLPAIVLSSLNEEMPLASASVNYEGALSAAEAGLQEYVNLNDQYSGYYDFPAEPGGATSANDHGLPGGSNQALGSWEAVSGSNPPEWFTYYPITSEIFTTNSATNPFGGDVVLVVTGKAGTGTGTQYRRIEAAMNLDGVITDVYFSNYEQPGAGDLDQWENTYAAGCQSACGLVTNSHEFDEATVTTPCTSGGVCYSPSEPMATALCQYDATEVNTFIDWYSTNVHPIYPQPGYPFNDTQTAYGPSNPYYGPWYGSFPDPADSAYQFGEAPTNGTIRNSLTGNGDQSACNTNYWISGDVFNGPVYSADELTTCGNPSFTTYDTGAPKNFPLPAEQLSGGGTVGWPGAATPKVVSGQLISPPLGYDHDPWGDCAGSGDNPTFTDPNSPRLGQSQPLPPSNQELATEIIDTYTSGPQPTLKTGEVGCLYTGPTMIRFSYNPATSSEVMDVWSPLTKDTYGPAADCGNVASNGAQDLCATSGCTGTGAGATSQVQNNTVQSSSSDFAQVSITQPTVIAVQNVPTLATDPNYWNLSSLPTAESNPTGAAGCIDPWINPDSTTGVTVQTCTAGDAILSGAVSYQTTVSAANNIIISRSLVYGCSVNPGGAIGTSYGTYEDSLTNCQSSPDSLGLIAYNEIWLSRPINLTSQTCTALYGDDNDMTPSSITWNDMAPDCVIDTNFSGGGSGAIVDGATAALNGFFEVEYWREGSATGTIYFNGSDAVNNAGQFGVFSGGNPPTLSRGDLLDLNYDPRLEYNPPPEYVQATNSSWNVVGWVSCSSTTPNPDTPGYPSGVPSCPALPNSYQP